MLQNVYNEKAVSLEDEIGCASQNLLRVGESMDSLYQTYGNVDRGEAESVNVDSHNVLAIREARLTEVLTNFSSQGFEIFAHILPCAHEFYTSLLDDERKVAIERMRISLDEKCYDASIMMVERFEHQIKDGKLILPLPGRYLGMVDTYTASRMLRGLICSPYEDERGGVKVPIPDPDPKHQT